MVIDRGGGRLQRGVLRRPALLTVGQQVPQLYPAVRPDPLVRDARLVDAGFGCPRSWIATGCPGINDPGAGLSKCFLRAASFFSTQATKPDYQGVRGVSRVIIVVGAGRPWVTKDTEGHLPRFGGSDCDDCVLRRTDEILRTQTHFGEDAVEIDRDAVAIRLESAAAGAAVPGDRSYGDEIDRSVMCDPAVEALVVRDA